MAKTLRQLLNGGGSLVLPPLAALALTCLATGAPPALAAVNAQCSGSPTANCTDAGPDGIHYTSGIDTVNVGDGVAGTTALTPGTTGIELSRAGMSGAVAPDVEFQVIEWDTDDDPETAKVDVVSRDGVTPLKDASNFILVETYDSNDKPATFSIGASTYSGMQLVEYLAAHSPETGGQIVGALTVNNDQGAEGAGAPLATTDATGIVASSIGGNGGPGRCGTILFWSWCADASGGGDAGSVVVNSNSDISVHGDSAKKFGISAFSQGGRGGDGGGWFGLFVSTPGGGGDGGDGGGVFVTLGTQSNITTHGDGGHGVFAQSRGGDGGSGGNSSGLVALGDNGGNGGNAGVVVVVNRGIILTTGWNAHGILARSVGAGAGTGSSTSGAYAEGGNGGGESSGAAVTVNNSGSITTGQDDSFGILAQSIGGGGGDGGGAGGWFTVGGRAGSGGGSGAVSIYESGSVQTAGDRSTALFAQSVGGGGGNGGDAVSISAAVGVAVGGAGGLGGQGNEVLVTSDGSDIDTLGDSSHGIHAQSIGGGGGNGGLAVTGEAVPSGSPLNVSVALGSNGGGGGDAGARVEVQALQGTTMDTGGAGSHGILAQSIGGGGGNGSMTFAGSGGPGLSLAVSIGGKGGVAGAGKEVVIDNAATITTHGDLSAGIFTQSIGGGGGNGSVAGSFALGGTAIGISLGGAGGSGGTGGLIDVVNAGGIDTHGQGAAGILAQSIGGGGGNGGSAIAGSIGLAAVSTTIGGGGGAGNSGDVVDILNTGWITTGGNNSAGIFAQSIGGGGGRGGDTTSLSLAGPVAVAVAIGGGGGSGGTGKKVTVHNDGQIQTGGPNSDGIFAQSIGGSGGAGGSATSGTLVFPVEIEGVEIPAISANVAVGGRGAGGGEAGAVEVSNGGEIVTTGFLSSGVFAQSVGGSGGKGGHASNISIAFDASFTGKVAVGGSGGQGGVGKDVTVNSSGLIRTAGEFSAAVLAQSVGGGGGTGGNATNLSLSLTPPPTAPEDFIPSPSANVDVAVGGDGGSGATAGVVTVNNNGTVASSGKFAPGVMAQSVGGSGGFGGDARTISVELTADPMDFLPLTDLTSLDLKMVFGGSGGSGSSGDLVHVTNQGTVVTTGAFSHGIIAQSIGGGGGNGGSAMSFEFSNTNVVPDIPVLDDISGLTTLEMTLQGSGGAGGDGGKVTLHSTGNITTSGAFAMGIVAQSVAGGGGLAGLFNPQGIVTNEIDESLFNTFVDTEAGLSFAGSVGGAGNAQEVIVQHIGNILTSGDGAHGLFAQSVAGSGTAGAVNITLDGSIEASGLRADGIFAQSGGGAGNGQISVLIREDGIVAGGGGSGAGVRIVGGLDNQVTNRGTIAAGSGNAIASGSAADTITNHGTITGSVLLGAGVNTFRNQDNGLFNAGSVVALGTGNALTNLGVLAPGGHGELMQTSLSGNLVQGTGGEMALDLDLKTRQSDRLNVAGSAALGGHLQLGLVEGSYAVPGTHPYLVVIASAGIDAQGLQLNASPSAVVSYALSFPSANELVVDAGVDFSPRTLRENARHIGDHVNAIQAAGGSASFAPFAAGLLTQPDLAALEAAYEMLSPAVVGNVTTLSAQASAAFNDAMHSCRQGTGEFRFVREGECGWFRVGRTHHDQGRTAYNDGYGVETVFAAGGVQGELKPDLHLGVGLSYQHTRLDARYSNVDGDRFEAGVMLKRRIEATRISASFSVGYGRYDSTRQIDVSGPAQVARSDQELWSASAQARVSHDLLQGDDAYVRPMLSAAISNVARHAYRETGAGGASLDVKAARDTVVAIQPAIELGGEHKLDDGMLLRPYLRLGMTHYIAGSDRKITATMLGAPDGFGAFTVTSSTDRTQADVAMGADLLRHGGSTFRLDYSGQFSRNSSTNTVWVKYSKLF